MMRDEKNKSGSDKYSDKSVQVLEKFFQLIESLEHKITLSEYMEMLSNTVDKRIIRKEKQSDLFFAGGVAKFSVREPEGRVEFQVDYFYKSEDGQWEKITEKGNTRISKFNAADEETLEFLKSSEAVEISIDPPLWQE